MVQFEPAEEIPLPALEKHILPAIVVYEDHASIPDGFEPLISVPLLPEHTFPSMTFVVQVLDGPTVIPLPNCQFDMMFFAMNQYLSSANIAVPIAVFSFMNPFEETPDA